MKNWVVIGTGNVGRTLVKLAPRVGAEVVATWSHQRPFDGRNHIVGDLEKLGDVVSDSIVFLSVRDDAIADVASRITGLDRAHAVFHLSGLLPSTILAPFATHYASIHPVLSITDPELAVERLNSAFWTAEGNVGGVSCATEILALIGVTPATIAPEKKALYHCAAVMAAGHFVTLLASAMNVAANAGLTEEEAERMLFTLSQSCLDTANQNGLDAAFTGPVARGDEQTIDAHRESLEREGLRAELSVYDALRKYPWHDPE